MQWIKFDLQWLNSDIQHRGNGYRFPDIKLHYVVASFNPIW